MVSFTGNNITKHHIYEGLRKGWEWGPNPQREHYFMRWHLMMRGKTVYVANVLELEEGLNSFVGSRLLPYVINNRKPEAKVDVFQIDDVSAFAGIDEYGVG